MPVAYTLFHIVIYIHIILIGMLVGQEIPENKVIWNINSNSKFMIKRQRVFAREKFIWGFLRHSVELHEIYSIPKCGWKIFKEKGKINRLHICIY